MSHQPGAGNPSRTPITLIVALVIALAFGGGYLLAKSGKTTAEPSVSPAPNAHHSASHSPKPSTSASGSPSPAPAGDLKDGRYFVYAKAVEGGQDGPLLLTFDLAYFYTGAEANTQAAAHGDEVPVPNDVYIVNDNAKLRQYPIASTATVKYIPPGVSALKKGDIDAFQQAVNATAATDYPDMRYAPWWIVITNGEVTSITQQFLP